MTANKSERLPHQHANRVYSLNSFSFESFVLTKGESEWNRWVKFSQSVQKNAPVAGFVSKYARSFMTAFPILPEAGSK